MCSWHRRSVHANTFGSDALILMEAQAKPNHPNRFLEICVATVGIEEMICCVAAVHSDNSAVLCGIVRPDLWRHGWNF